MGVKEALAPFLLDCGLKDPRHAGKNVLYQKTVGFLRRHHAADTTSEGQATLVGAVIGQIANGNPYPGAQGELFMDPNQAPMVKVDIAALRRGQWPSPQAYTVPWQGEPWGKYVLDIPEGKRRIGLLAGMTSIDGFFMRPDAAAAFQKLRDAAMAAGHTIGITNAYRDDARQAHLYWLSQDLGKGFQVARAGRSNHRDGIAFDLKWSSDAAFQWLLANSERFNLFSLHKYRPKLKDPYHFTFGEIG